MMKLLNPDTNTVNNHFIPEINEVEFKKSFIESLESGEMMKLLNPEKKITLEDISNINLFKYPQPFSN